MATTDFSTAAGTHVLMITNHGVHEWQVVPGMPDTGGQNVYVNQLTEALINQGYRVTIINRGGYAHPETGEPRTGTVYHPSGRARIVYIEDGTPEFIRKEDMDEQIPALTDDLEEKLAVEGFGYDLIISNYWDAGKIGAALNDRSARRVPHVWIPHSLGTLKKKNMDPSAWESLRIDERIDNEQLLIAEIDSGVATSSAIRDTFIEDYRHHPRYFLPPCVDTERFRPQSHGCDHIWDFLASQSTHNAIELQGRQIVTEISRTDRTKRKDVLIRAFARAREQVPDITLVVALDHHAGEPYDAAMVLIQDLDLERDVIVLGSVWDQLPCLYAVTSVYCTPSVMEGFGMSAQEAAATGIPVVSSDLVPFAVEYLLGDEAHRVPIGGEDCGSSLLVGEGAIVVPADDVDGFSKALIVLLSSAVLRTEMGNRALDITVPYFTWETRTTDLLNDLGITPGGGEA
ncbi:MAG: glycosyltransferase [Actinomycetota bacterium]|nr:glycosyltransferase [Actinomycetota bacterium]